ncbi:hypothetical protein OJ996_03055 [Luteolibacter sp. GHJ8]|uniref:DUF3592 domain-containing protein n=1 Tax=Luteolibacter rhizosphaerae TaxID=2989719 RepID=A0ABT3FY83_9BACT|nr:hypothetical protein [Luteolibacter rhizosphaerae]MCW1912536.1 hypothetical protein [Luteolibacter rhizosphaerae]
MSAPTEDGTRNHRHVRFVGIGFCALVLIIFGLSFKEAWSTLTGQFWRSTPCIIERFEIVADRGTTPAFTADLLFHYQFDGIRHTGTRLWPAKQGDRDYRSLAEVPRAPHQCRGQHGRHHPSRHCRSLFRQSLRSFASRPRPAPGTVGHLAPLRPCLRLLPLHRGLPADHRVSQELR